MKVPFSLCFLLMPLAACGAGREQAREFNGDTAMAYVNAQMAFGPRIPNTDGHRKTGDWILEKLKSRADSVEVQAFEHISVTGEKLQLRNFIGRFRPALKDRILYVAHWDTRPKAENSPNLADQRRPTPGANDGASGVAVLLGVADALKKLPPTFGVDLVFVDGEDFGDFGVDKDVFMGTRYFVKNLEPASAKPLFAIVFDMVGDADLQICQESYSMAGAPEVVERVWTRAEELGYGRSFRPGVTCAVSDDHVVLQKAGIRAIDVIDFEYGPSNKYWHTTDDTADKVSAKSLGIVGDVAVALTR
ncbi:MAG: M28 family peptidase [Gemmatimonadetes bacterium]|nr:M28 family peptidase [Gemmatimonadota bacterium]